MCKILIAGKTATHVDIARYVGDTHSVEVIENSTDAKRVFDNGYYDFVIASQNGDMEIIFELLTHIRSKSKEAVIIVMLTTEIFEPETLKWVHSLAENVGVDYFIPYYDRSGEILSIAVMSAATRLKQRSLGPRFNELAGKLIQQLS
jgi:hypothetical protein